MTDIVTGCGGISSNEESFSSNPYDVFYEPKFNDEIGEPFEQDYHPLSTGSGENGVPYQFLVRSERDTFIRLDNARIGGEAKVVKEEDGTNVDGSKDEWTVVNNVYMALFSSIALSIMGTNISDTTTNPNLFKSFLFMLLNFSREFKNKVLSNPGFNWFPDKYIGNSNIKQIDDSAAANKPEHPFAKRKKDLKVDYQEFSIPLLTDLVTSKKYLPPGQTMEITLTRSEPEFYMILNLPNGSDKLKIVLKDVHLTFEKVPISEAAVIEFQRTLKTKRMKMHFTQTRMKPYSVVAGNTDWGQYEFHVGILPRSVYICFQKQSVYNGSYATNPYVFENPVLDEAQLIWNSRQYPVKPWTTNKKKKVKLYNAFLANTGGNLMESTSVPISYEEYYKNFFILAWDRTRARDNGFRYQRGEEGHLSINLKVDLSPNTYTMTEPIVVIVMMCFDSVVNFEGDAVSVVKL